MRYHAIAMILLMIGAALAGCTADDTDYDDGGAPPTDWGIDSDGDGVMDNADAFPNDANETIDTDGDGVGDNADVFPEDPDETIDSDDDGVGDNADAFPNDANETTDSDGDGVGDNADAFPTDPGETVDRDGDGVGDNADLCYSPIFPGNEGETGIYGTDGIGTAGCYGTPGNFPGLMKTKPGHYVIYGGSYEQCDRQVEVDFVLVSFTVTYGINLTLNEPTGFDELEIVTHSDIIGIFTRDVYYVEDDLIDACEEAGWEDTINEYDGTYADRVTSLLILEINGDNFLTLPVEIGAGWGDVSDCAEAIFCPYVDPDYWDWIDLEEEWYAWDNDKHAAAVDEGNVDYYDTYIPGIDFSSYEAMILLIEPHNYQICECMYAWPPF